MDGGFDFRTIGFNRNNRPLVNAVDPIGYGLQHPAARSEVKGVDLLSDSDFSDGFQPILCRNESVAGKAPRFQVADDFVGVSSSAFLTTPAASSP